MSDSSNMVVGAYTQARRLGFGASRSSAGLAGETSRQWLAVPLGTSYALGESTSLDLLEILVPAL